MQLSAKINGGLVLLASEAGCIQLLHCSTPVFYWFSVCTGVGLPWWLYTFGHCPCLREKLDLKEKDEVCTLDYYVLVWL